MSEGSGVVSRELSPLEADCDTADLTAFADLYRSHAAHLFDYCSMLTSDAEAAARATEIALVTAQSLLQDPDRMRAWLFALVRRECQVSGAGPTEARQLVSRHGILPEDLPTVLGVAPEQARALLAEAQENPSRAGTALAGTVFADEPLAAVPASVWLRSADTVLHLREGEAGSRRDPRASLGRFRAVPARKQLWLAAGVLAPAAAVVGTVMYLTGQTHPGSPARQLGPAAGAASPGAAAPHQPVARRPHGSSRSARLSTPVSFIVPINTSSTPLVAPSPSARSSAAPSAATSSSPPPATSSSPPPDASSPPPSESPTPTPS